MGYDRLNLKDGDILTAEHIEHIENGIAAGMQLTDDGKRILEAFIQKEIDREEAESYIALEFNTFTRTYFVSRIQDNKETFVESSDSSYEKGTKIDKITAKWSFNKKPEELAFGKKPVNGNAFTGDSLPVTQTEITIGEEKEGETKQYFTTDMAWRIQATGENGENPGKDISLSFFDYVYYGVSSNSNITVTDQADIIGLKKEIGKVSSFNVTAGAGEYIYYCLPQYMGTCVFTVGVLPGGFSLVSSGEFTNASGHPEDYYIYRSNNANLGSKTVQVS